MRDPQTCERTRKPSTDSPNNTKRETSIRKLKVKFFCDKTLVSNLGLHKYSIVFTHVNVKRFCLFNKTQNLRFCPARLMQKWFSLSINIHSKQDL